MVGDGFILLSCSEIDSAKDALGKKREGTAHRHSSHHQCLQVVVIHKEWMASLAFLQRFIRATIVPETMLKSQKLPALYVLMTAVPPGGLRSVRSDRTDLLLGTTGVAGGVETSRRVFSTRSRRPA